MSLARVTTFAFQGIEAVPVEVEVQIAPGLPAFLVVGLPDKAVAESRERVRAALTGMGLSLPPKRVLVNMAPADLTKEGSHFDLPIAVALLAALEIIPREDVEGTVALGELSLDGRLVPVAGALPAAMAAAVEDRALLCPKACGAEALSGLAQSFLYAGARSLLVSHWPVESRSAVALMTGLFRHRAADPSVGAARAQQLAILDMIDHPADPRWSHPAYWAPFVLVGNPD